MDTLEDQANRKRNFRAQKGNFGRAETLNSIFTVAGLFLLLIAIGLSVMNVFSGFALIERQTEYSEGHLIRGILIVLCSIIGNLILIRQMQLAREKEFLESKDAEKPRSPDSSLSQNVIVLSLIVSVIALITGTISHPGSFPLLHGGLGFALIVTLLASFGTAAAKLLKA